jgi:hypothetical protein
MLPFISAYSEISRTLFTVCRYKPLLQLQYGSLTLQATEVSDELGIYGRAGQRPIHYYHTPGQRGSK